MTISLILKHKSFTVFENTLVMTYQKPWQKTEYGIKAGKPTTYLEQTPKTKEMKCCEVLSKSEV